MKRNILFTILEGTLLELIVTFFYLVSRTIAISDATSFIIWLIVGLLVFYRKGKKTRNPHWFERYGVFIVILFVSLGIGLSQGNQFGDSLTLVINHLLVYFLPVLQVICLIGYTLGLRTQVK